MNVHGIKQYTTEYIHVLQHTSLTIIYIISDQLSTNTRFVVFVIGYVLHCCFSMLIQTAQSTFTPTEDCTWQHGART